MEDNTYYSFNLRDLYAMIAFDEKELLKQTDKNTALNYFYPANQIYNLISYLKNKKICNQHVYILIPNLRDIYLNHINQLSENEQNSLKVDIEDKDLPRLKLINSKISEKYDYFHLPEYFNFYKNHGDITFYDYVLLTVPDFVSLINNNEQINLILDGTNIIINLDYKRYDFWDNVDQKNLDKVIC